MSEEPRKAQKSKKLFSDDTIPHNDVKEPGPHPVVKVESPVEDKIHVLMEQPRVYIAEPQKVEVSPVAQHGWKSINTEVVLELPPRNGIPVYLSETPEGDGVLVFWKRVRAFANSTKRWQETGIWVDHNTGAKVSFEPKYWRERF